jgi:hypothetical protein
MFKLDTGAQAPGALRSNSRVGTRKAMQGNLVLRIGILLFILLAPLISYSLRASEQAVAIDYLHGEDDLSGLRLAYRPYHTTLTKIEWLGEVDLYWELSVNFWEFGADNQHETNYALALSPVISSQFATIADKYPLKWEFGIGDS